MKYNFTTLILIFIFGGCAKSSEDRTYPKEYDFKNWVEMKTEVKNIVYYKSSAWNKLLSAPVVSKIVFNTEALAVKHGLHQFTSDVNFDIHNLLVSKPIYISENNRLEITQPRFWFNFSTKEYYNRFGETLYYRAFRNEDDSAVLISLVPKIPEDFNARIGFEPK